MSNSKLEVLATLMMGGVIETSVGHELEDWEIDFESAAIERRAQQAPGAHIPLISQADAQVVIDELLEALEATNLLLRTKRHACASAEVCHVLDTHINRSRAAIAKAKGES